MTLADRMEQSVDAALNNQSKMRKALTNLGVETNVLRRVAPLDDGTPPGQPTNVIVAPFIRTLAINWDKPAELDAVERIELTVSSASEHIEIEAADSVRGHTVMDLLYDEPYTVMIRFIDYFDREGPWSDPVTVTPYPDPKTGITELKEDILGVINESLDDNLFTGPTNKIPNDKFEKLEDALMFGEGVISAEAMIAHDAAAMRLWVKNGAIENAMVDTLSASKIVSGEITATKITVASLIEAVGGGRIVGGGAKITQNGLELNTTGSGINWPSNSRADWLTPTYNPESEVYPRPFGGITFFAADSTEAGRAASRGVLITASGIRGASRTGRVRIQVSDGSEDNGKNTSAYIDITSVAPNANMTFPQILLSGSVRITGGFFPRTEAELTLGANSQPIEFNSQGGVMCRLYQCSFKDDGNIYRPFVHGNNGFRTSVENDNTGRAYITNENGNPRTVMINFYG